MKHVVENSFCKFTIEPKRIYLTLKRDNHTFLIETANPNKKTPPLRLKDDEFIDVIDMIYRRKIRDERTFIEMIYSKYKLTTVYQKVVL